MKPFLVKPASFVKGSLEFSGDKSIAHRALILSALSFGKTVINNFPRNKDCLFTLRALQKLGVSLKLDKFNRVEVFGKGLFGLGPAEGEIFTGESGTTIRLFLGLLAGQQFSSVLTAAKSLSKRPMHRVTVPLRLMGAKINARRITHNARQEEFPPLFIRGSALKAITYKMPVASAQVKSAILLAGLYAQGKTKIVELVKTRDHTERILESFGVSLKVKKNTIILENRGELHSPGRVYVPGDISSASFFMVLGVILPDSCILLRNVSLNPTRCGIVTVLKRMGADLKVKSKKLKVKTGEPYGDIIVKSSRLKAASVNKDEIPLLIDELPILMVAACFAKGRSVFQGVQELRIKETDRVFSMTYNLCKMGAEVKSKPRAGTEALEIIGPVQLHGAKLKSFGDHRTAMCAVIAGLAAKGNTRIDDVECISKSFPDFLKVLKILVS